MPRALVPDFSEAMLDRVGSISIGYGLDPEATMGPVNNRPQLGRIRAIHSRLAETGADVRTTGRVLSPDRWDEGYYLRAAVVVDADPTDPLVLEEQFGPILPIVGYDTEEQAIEMASATEYGLGSSVWSSDPEHAAQRPATVTYSNAGDSPHLDLSTSAPW